MAVERPPSSRDLVFGCVPDTDDEQTRIMLIDLCAILSEVSGQRIRPHRAPSPAALASAFDAGRVHVAWISPTLLLTSVNLAEALPIANSLRQGVAAYHGVLFVRDDSPRREPKDLLGASVAWVAASSAAGYLFPRLALAARGLDPRTLFASELFLESHGNVARAVLEGRADVGAVYAVFEQGDATRPLLRAPFVEPVAGHTGRVLLATSAIPSDLIVVARALPARSRLALVEAFEALNDDVRAREPIRHVLGADGFIRHDPAMLDDLRNAVAEGKARGLLDDPA